MFLLSPIVFGPERIQCDFIQACDPANAPEPIMRWILGFLGDPAPKQIPSQLNWALDPRGFAQYGRYVEPHCTSDQHLHMLLMLGLKVCVMYSVRKNRSAVLRRMTRSVTSTTTNISPPAPWMTSIVESVDPYLRHIYVTYPTVGLKRSRHRRRYEKQGYLCLTRNDLTRHWIKWAESQLRIPPAAYKALGYYLFECIWRQRTLDQLDVGCDRMLILR